MPSVSNRSRAAWRKPPQQHQQHQHQSKTDARHLKRKREGEDLAKIQEAIKELDPRSPSIKNFSDLPLCEATAKGLRASHFEVLTDIQARAIPLALKGRDILGAAKTGSGKTLAFLVPLLERLYAARWTHYDGLGALIISPTRELAVQIFEVLRKVGRHHDLSAGLVIGGKSLESEAQHLAGMSILVCTPGRMLQHLDQTPGLSYDNLQMLVLDEADRIMDVGFEAAVNALVDHLPRTRQTLLFSATQSRRVSDLARLSLRDPEYLSVHHEAAAATPAGLQQHYIVAPVAEKLDTLWGFVRANLNTKMMVFFSSGKQVRFAYESFKRMQPGISLLHLHGRQKQAARLEITTRFTAARHACLLATDVVARGVDFPAVDWVIQVDAPEDADTYIHRVGRTARYESDGRAVLFLDPSEEAGMLARLAHKKVPVQKVAVKEKKRQSIREELQKLCFQLRDVKYLAQKAFISYVRSVHLQKDKDVFRLDRLDLDGYAASLGLPETPQIRFQKGEDVKRLKNASRTAARLLDGSDTDEDEDLTVGGGEQRKKETKAKDEVRTKFQKMTERTNQDVLSSHYLKLMGEENGGGGGQNADKEADEFFSVKRVLRADGNVDVDLDAENKHALDDNNDHNDHNDHDTKKHTVPPVDVAQPQGDAQKPKVVKLGRSAELVIDSRRREKLLGSKKRLLRYMDHGTRVVFGDDGTARPARPAFELQGVGDFPRQGPAEEQRRAFVEGEAARVREADVVDKALARQKRRDKRARQRTREKEEMEMEDEDEEDEDDGGRQSREDPLALLRSLPMSGGGAGGGAARGEEDGVGDGEAGYGEGPRKKARKWFQRDDDDDEDGEENGEIDWKWGAKKRRREKDGNKRGSSRSSRKVVEIDHEPETLEDFEALAAGLLE